jgi:hypothetical protein
MLVTTQKKGKARFFKALPVVLKIPFIAFLIHVPQVRSLPGAPMISNGCVTTANPVFIYRPILSPSCPHIVNVFK